jgi:hypothetical protein
MLHDQINKSTKTKFVKSKYEIEKYQWPLLLLFIIITQKFNLWVGYDFIIIYGLLLLFMVCYYYLWFIVIIYGLLLLFTIAITILTKYSIHLLQP